jgi:hypothetical protein
MKLMFMPPGFERSRQEFLESMQLILHPFRSVEVPEINSPK